MSVKPATDIEAIKGYIEKQDRQLINQMLNSLDIVRDLDVRRNVREPLALNKMTVDAGARPLNVDIETAKSGRKWTKRVLTPQRAMKIIKMIPEELRETFMSEMLDINAKEVPFAAWVWQQEFAKIAQEINDNFYFSKYHGEPEEWASGDTYAVDDLVYFNEIIYKCVTITTAGESPASASAKWEDVDNKVICDGPDTIIKDAIANDGLLAVGTGTYDETDAYAYVKDMWGAVPEAHKNNNGQGMIANVSYGTHEDLAVNVNKLFGSGAGIGAVDIEEGRPFTLKGTGGRLRVMPRTWMGGSRRIIITPPGNLIVGMNQVSDANKVGKMVDTLHGFRGIVKWMIGTQFRDIEPLYVNDQD
ncbi:hypothetical protein [Cyclobacterium jeungdonense]|uniref:Major capsid protein n=1 Tax=Cyclobacterium jeungdonense TaxID=708087 RepID=A0ABT8C824_9BACT|nr:hypothetical protein [Cyclobacterium jeungdonense]MDN3688676.1 hypothetical protein [Cyclobacterium jeungdonense]